MFKMADDKNLVQRVLSGEPTRRDFLTTAGLTGLTGAAAFIPGLANAADLGDVSRWSLKDDIPEGPWRPDGGLNNGYAVIVGAKTPGGCYVDFNGREWEWGNDVAIIHGELAERMFGRDVKGFLQDAMSTSSDFTQPVDRFGSKANQAARNFEKAQNVSAKTAHNLSPVLSEHGHAYREHGRDSQILEAYRGERAAILNVPKGFPQHKGLSAVGVYVQKVDNLTAPVGMGSNNGYVDITVQLNTPDKWKSKLSVPVGDFEAYLTPGTGLAPQVAYKHLKSTLQNPRNIHRDPVANVFAQNLFQYVSMISGQPSEKRSSIWGIRKDEHLWYQQLASSLTRADGKPTTMKLSYKG